MNVCVVLGALALFAGVGFAATDEPVGRPFEVKIRSSADGTDQPALGQVPKGYDAGTPAPLLVGLHTWSGQYKQQAKAMGPRASKRGWLLVLPNFRGPNKPNNPRPTQACASILAQRDVIDAVSYMREHYAVDERRIYLVGASGGGHMAQVMAGKYPDLWAGVSAWVGISDIAKWQVENKGYAAGVHACAGGKPGDSAEVDWEYLRRSPITFIQNASNLPLDIQHGRNDKSVPFHHSVESYERVSQVPGHRARLTVFNGGHEIKYDSAFNWLSKQRRAAAPPTTLWLATDEAKSYYYVHMVPADPLAVGTCKIVVTSGPKLSIEMAGLRELRIDPVAAGLGRAGAAEVAHKCDGRAETLMIGSVRVELKAKTGGVQRVSW